MKTNLNKNKDLHKVKSFCSNCNYIIFYNSRSSLATEIIFEYKTRNQVNVQDLISAIHDADIILLGEIHDNCFSTEQGQI